MKTIKLFTDGSVHPQTKMGYGAYFILEDENESLDSIKTRIQLKPFHDTSSTKLELEVLLWALEDEKIYNKAIIVYTDCQNILGLKQRRTKLESNDYKTATGKIVKNHELYKRFYEVTNRLSCQFIKVQGHKKSSQKDATDRWFHLVDKASRKALREALEKE